MKSKNRSPRLRSRVLTTTSAVITVACCVVTLLSAYGGMVDPRKIPVAAIAAMGFPAMWLLTLIAGAINLIFISRKLAAVSGITLIACIGPWLTFSPINRDRTDSVADGDTTLTVMQWNAFYFNPFDPSLRTDGPNPAMTYLTGSDADIVCMQEVYPTPAPDAERQITAGQLRQYQEAYPYRIDIWIQAQAFISKYPIRLVETHQFDDESAMFSTVVATVGSREIYIINAHLQSLYLSADDKEAYHDITGAGVHRSEVREVRRSLLPKLVTAFRKRAEQAEYLRRYIESLPAGAPIILTGDFNDTPGCYAARQIMKAGLRDAYADAALGPTVTYSANRFYFRIDQIFYGGPVEPLRVWRGELRYSDHFPLLARFLIK